MGSVEAVERVIHWARRVHLASRGSIEELEAFGELGVALAGLDSAVAAGGLRAAPEAAPPGWVSEVAQRLERLERGGAKLEELARVLGRRVDEHEALAGRVERL